MIQYRGKNKIRQRNYYLKAEFGGNIMDHNLTELESETLSHHQCPQPEDKGVKIKS